MNWLFLSLAIGFEVIATSALKASAGFTRVVPTAVVLIFYASAFFCLSLALRTIPMGIAYAIWSGIGIVVISLIGLLVYQQRLDVPAMLGIALIIAGTIVINVWSRTGSA